LQKRKGKGGKTKRDTKDIDAMGGHKIRQGGRTQEVSQMKPRLNTCEVEQLTPHKPTRKQNDQKEGK
jgi:hypothetical protein